MNPERGTVARVAGKANRERRIANAGSYFIAITCSTN